MKFIFFTLLLDVLGFGLLIPVAPKLVQSMLHAGQGGIESEAAPYVAALQSTFYAMAFLFAPALGALSDRIGRRPVILISLFGSGVDYLAMAMAPTLPWLFATRVINGLTGASFSVASAYVADVTSPEKRAAAYGLVGAAFGLGFVIGPIIGGFLGEVDIRLPFYAASGLTLMNWLYGLFVLPESLPQEHRSPFRWRRANPIGALYSLGRYPLVLSLAMALFLLHMAQFALHATWALSLQHRFNWSPVLIGLSLAVVGIGAAIVQGGFARRIIPALGDRKSLLLGVIAGAVAYFVYGAVPPSPAYGWWIYLGIVIGSIGAIAQPASQSIITKAVLPTEQGTIQGAIASLSSLAGILGPMIGGWTLATFIAPDSPFSASPIPLQGMNFYLSGILAVAGLAIAARATRVHTA